MKIIAIIVCYNSREEEIKKTVKSINKQVDYVIIVNNDSSKYDYNMFENVYNIILDENFGIAYAQNIGIKKALELKADFVLLSDQDTIYPERYIESFSPFLNEKKAAVYCPTFYNTVSNSFAPLLIKKFQPVYDISEPTYVEQAIASGSIIDVNCFEKVGFMDERLFIDYVDQEFCWRLTSNGYKILAVPSIVITHSLGERQKTILGREITIWNDIRFHYLIRNAIFLATHSEFLVFNERMKLMHDALYGWCVNYFLLNHNLKSIGFIFTAIFNGLFKKLGKK